jgi:hypothetical protein
VNYSKERWTGLEHQVPAPKLEIFLPKNYSPNPDYAYSADPGKKWLSKLLGYAFSESVDDLDGSFSFTVENEDVDRNGKTVFDIIPIRSVIKIYEGDMEHPAFVGIIRRRHIGTSMTAQGVKRTITFSGKSVISLVAEYTVSLDFRISEVAVAAAKQNEMISRLAGVRKISELINVSCDFFNDVALEVTDKSNGISNTEVAEIISRHIGAATKDFVTVSGKEQNTAYDIAMIFFNEANNTIADVWRNLLPKPVYEIFSYCDKKSGKPKIMVRQVPYGYKGDEVLDRNNDWNELDSYEISPLSLTGYELDQNDEEVYTVFASYIIGSARDRNFYMAVSQENQEDSTRRYDSKTAVYGFRPLEISFLGYDRRGNTRNEANDALTGALTKMNRLAAYWYSRLDDMYSGSITICTDFNKPETNPRVGCRAKFMGGEFYINRTDHFWNFGGTPTIKLTVSRGMVYDEGIMRDGAAGIIPNIGGRYRELERGSA